jgi:hypothetical protein
MQMDDQAKLIQIVALLKGGSIRQMAGVGGSRMTEVAGSRVLPALLAARMPLAIASLVRLPLRPGSHTARFTTH